MLKKTCSLPRKRVNLASLVCDVSVTYSDASSSVDNTSIADVL